MNKNIQLQKILEHWELGNPNLYACLKEDDGRVLFYKSCSDYSYLYFGVVSDIYPVQKESCGCRSC